MTEVDVLIITALKIEYDAARDAGSAGYAANPGVSSWEDQGLETPVPFLLGDYILADGSRLSVALARPTRMGGTATAPVVSSLVERLKPGCLAMCGVCAGNPADVALGDVIVAEMAYLYDEGGRTRDTFVADHRQIPLSDTWVRAAQDMSTRDLPSFGEVPDDEAKIWLLERLYAGDDPRQHPARSRYVLGNTWVSLIRDLQDAGLVQRTGPALSLTDDGFSYIEDVIYSDVTGPAKLPFAVVVGPMASGNVVVKDGLTWAQLAQWGVRFVAGLEMEAAAIAQTAHRLEVPDWVVVKGVMDHADPRKDDRYKPFAARASAEVLFKLLTLRVASSNARPRMGRTSRLRSAYVIGGVTEETDYPDYEEAELAEVCRRLGETVAKAGADLIVCSPFPDSADFQALMGYVKSGVGRAVHLHSPRHAEVREKEIELRAMLGAKVADQIKNWHYPGPEADDPESLGQAWLLCQLMALDQADVVISIGGRVSRTANTILHLAEARQKPIVPFEFLGGASGRAFHRRNWARAYPGLDFGKLRDKAAVVDAMEIANYMVTARMRGARSYAWPPKHLFISRARPDAEFGRILDGYLSSAGFNVLLGEKELPSDRMVESAIKDAVLGSDLFIVLWSRSYAASKFCYDEIELAVQRHRAGELQLWIVNLDGSDIVPRGARDLPQTTARTPHALVAVIRDLLEPILSPNRTNTRSGDSRGGAVDT
jgi:nucleoside phosphorylase